MTTPAFVASAIRQNGTGASMIGDRPSSTATNEYWLAYIKANSLGAASDMTITGTPSGWSALVSFTNLSANGRHAHALYGKAVADASGESATYTWTCSDSSTVSTVIIMRFSGVNTGASPFENASAQNNSTADATVETPSITTAGAERLVISLGGQYNITSATYTPSGGTEIHDNYSVASALGIAGATDEYASATGSTTARTFTASAGTGASQGITVALLPAGWTTRTAPDAILGMHNLTGSLTDIDDDPDSADASWLVVG